MTSTTTDSRTGGDPGFGGRAARTVRSSAPPARAPGVRSGRIPGLDGLRAFAVLAVIGYHVAPGWLPGGYVGVDVFFVVSGFLITTLLLREADATGRMSLPAFWRRRARRLLPALLLVVVTAVLAAAVLDRDLLVGIRRQVVGALTFSTNWVEIAAGTSYFDATQPQLFQPFWSLAIEEQFYLLWPVALAVLVMSSASWARRARWALAAAAGSALLMAVLSFAGADPTRVYYGTDTHAFGLLLGVAIAFAVRAGPPTTPRQRGTLRVPAALVPVVALVGLAVVARTMPAESPVTYRGGLLLASLLAGVAVLGCATGSSALTRVLDVPVLRWVGDRSYGLYLWHWPVVLLVSARIGAQVGTARWWLGAVTAVVVTFVAAAASYRWLETPVRREGARGYARRVLRAPDRRAVVPLAGAAVVISLVTVVALTAPAVSEAQRAVEEGQRAVEEGQAAIEEAGGPTAPGSPDAATPTAAPDAGPGGPVTGADVVGFGDSVLSAAAPTVLERFPGIALDAKPIRKWVDAPAVVQQAADAGLLRPVVVLAFGTNGGFQFDGSREAVESVLDVIGPDRQVVVLTIVGVSHWVPDANATLVAVASERPNVHVADWAAVVAEHPGLLHTDETHPNMDGVVAYADLLERTFAALPPVEG